MLQSFRIPLRALVRTPRHTPHNQYPRSRRVDRTVELFFDNNNIIQNIIISYGRSCTIAWSTTSPPSSGRVEKVSDDDCNARQRPLRWRHSVIGSTTRRSDDSCSSNSHPPVLGLLQLQSSTGQLQPDARHLHRHRRHQLQRPSPLVCRRRLMPRPVFPIVRLPYDQPDRVARVLDAVRRELTASPRRQSAVAPAPAGNEEPGHDRQVLRPDTVTMTAREPEKLTDAGTDAGTSAVEQVTVGVRDCTLTPKARPEIMVTTNLLQDNDERQRPAQSGASVGPYLLVPPVNITAEISRPPLTQFQHQYHHATTS